MYKSTILQPFEKKSQHNKKINLIKLFNVPYAPLTVQPQNDFYTYINYSWLSEETKLSKLSKKYYVKIDSFRVIQEKVYYELIDLTKNYIKNNTSEKSKQISNVYTSFLHLNSNSAQKHVYNSVKMIDNFIKKDNLWKFLAHINKNEVVSWGSPIVWSVSPDRKNSKYLKSTISEPTLSLYDYTLYIDDKNDTQNVSQYKKNVKKNILNFLKQCLKNV